MNVNIDKYRCIDKRYMFAFVPVKEERGGVLAISVTLQRGSIIIEMKGKQNKINENNIIQNIFDINYLTKYI